MGSGRSRVSSLSNTQYTIGRKSKTASNVDTPILSDEVHSGLSKAISSLVRDSDKDFDSSLVSSLEKRGTKVNIVGGNLLNEFGMTSGVNESLFVLSRLLEVSNRLFPDKLDSVTIGQARSDSIIGAFSGSKESKKYIWVYFDALKRSPESRGNYNTKNYFNVKGERVCSLPVTTHEFGHFVDCVYKDRLGNTLSHKILADPMARKQAVSMYGDKNELEAFAEAFTLYCYGVRETKLGNPYYQEFKRVMQKEGLSAFNDCLVPSTNGKAVTPKKSNTSSSSIRSSKSTNGKAITPKKSSIPSTPVRVNKSTNGKAVRNKPSPLPKPAMSGKCPNCGGAISSDWNFCQHCGYKLK